MTNFDSKPLTHRYLDLLRELYSIQFVANWINEKAVSDPNYEWLISCLTRNQAQASVLARSNADVLASYLEGTVIIVSGAGAWEANGKYKFHRILNGAGLFRKLLKYEDEITTVSMYRCRMQNKTMQWFISIIPENVNPGTSADNDLYYSTAIGQDNDGRPPLSKWEPVEAKYIPIPTIMITTGLPSDGTFDDDEGRSDDEDDSDHEDSMAVIDDEYAYINSAPGTPVD